jgi:hypothetical protein
MQCASLAIVLTLCSAHAVAADGPTAAAAEEAPAPQVSISTVGDDTVVMAADGPQLVIAVGRKTGMGMATLLRAAGAWPPRVVVRFAGFSAVAAFGLVTDRITVRGSVEDAGKMPFGFVADPSRTGDAGAAADAGTLAVDVVQEDGHIDFILPRDLLYGSQVVVLSWLEGAGE